MKKYHIVLTFILLACTLGGNAHEINRITGTVVNAEDESPLPGVNVILKGTTIGTVTDKDGKFELRVPDPEKAVLVFSLAGMATKEIKVKNKTVLKIRLASDVLNHNEVVQIVEHEIDVNQPAKKDVLFDQALHGKLAGVESRIIGQRSIGYVYQQYPANTNSEEYANIEEWGYHGAVDKPLSTFSIDVDAASYANVRRFLNDGQKPPADAVRVEEMINYFTYAYPEPDKSDPFAVYTEVSEAPWNKKHKLVHIGLQGKKISTDNLPPSNLVFLLDVSGSMSAANKLPLLKKAFRMLTAELREQDKVSIVVYAGAAGVVLEPTGDKQAIMEALENLHAGGSTAGGAGIIKAYRLAEKEFIKGGNNRVILATDGDFNVGVSSPDDLEKLITAKRKSGIFLTVLGFGTGNLKDNRMETLANKGNGNYAYIDNIQEARKVFVNEFGGTLFTIAKDVKIQVEFNPDNVQAYRLIGYENRALNDEDFNNDRKDAGELGAGHTVTALYEIIPAGIESDIYSVDPLKYQQNKTKGNAAFSDELLTVKLRYKNPDADRSQRITHVIRNRSVSLSASTDSFRWSAAVAAFGMFLRNSEYLNDFSLDEIAILAQDAVGEDREGYRRELVRLIKSQTHL